MIIGVSIVFYPTRNHTNNRFDANRCWRGGSQWLMKMGNLRLFKLCWKLKWVNKIRSPLMLQNVFWCQPLWPLEHVYVTNLDLVPSDRLRNLRQRRKTSAWQCNSQSLWVSKFEGYIERNPGSGRQRCSGNIWANPARWKELQNMSSYTSKPLHQHPPLDEFTLDAWRNCSLELRKRLCDQIIWQRNLGHCKNSWEQSKNWNWTNQRTNVDWSLRYSSTFPPALQQKLYIRTMLCFQMAISLRVGDGLCSRCWRKHRKAALVTDFRPIESIRLFYKIFAYIILHRIQPCLDNHQPEEQHGFRAGRRLQEHLLTANLFLDKTLAANMPVWILSLDLSKAFDRVDWGALWLASSEHGVSSHMLWIIQGFLAQGFLARDLVFHVWDAVVRRPNFCPQEWRDINFNSGRKSQKKLVPRHGKGLRSTNMRHP